MVFLLALLLVLPMELDALSSKQLGRVERSWEKASGWILARRRASGDWIPELDPALSGMIGSQDGILSTTLGHLESKQCASRKDWCGVIAGLLDSLALDNRDTVAVAMTGSFAGLNLAVLLVLEEAGIPYRCVSSLGASTYGANSESYNWPQVETWLRERRLLEQGSSLVTPGGSGDRLSTSSLETLWAAERTLKSIPQSIHPGSLRQGIELREELLGPPEHCSMLINIGGGHAVLGTTSFSQNSGSGLLGDQARRALAEPSSQEGIKGLMQRWFELGIPTLHLLHVQDLAAQWGIPCMADSIQVKEPGE